MSNNKTMTGLELKWETLLVYLVPVLGFIFSFIKNNNVSEDARFHYRQAGAACIVYAAVSTVLSIFASISTALAIASLGGLVIFFGIFEFALGAIDTVVLVFSIIAIVKAFNNQKYEIPVINNIGNMIWKK
jgi:uncharacterized membrane protein